MRDTDWFRGIPDLVLDERISYATRDHAYDLQRIQGLSHTGLDGSSSADRMKRYFPGNFSSAENLAWITSFSGPMETILDLFIDDNVLDRGHRKALMNRDFTRMGACVTSKWDTYHDADYKTRNERGHGNDPGSPKIGRVKEIGVGWKRKPDVQGGEYQGLSKHERERKVNEYILSSLRIDSDSIGEEEEEEDNYNDAEVEGPGRTKTVEGNNTNSFWNNFNPLKEMKSMLFKNDCDAEEIQIQDHNIFEAKAAAAGKEKTMSTSDNEEDKKKNSSTISSTVTEPKSNLLKTKFLDTDSVTDSVSDSESIDNEDSLSAAEANSTDVTKALAPQNSAANKRNSNRVYRASSSYRHSSSNNGTSRNSRSSSYSDYGYHYKKKSTSRRFFKALRNIVLFFIFILVILLLIALGRRIVEAIF